MCIECSRAYVRDYYSRNSEALIAAESLRSKKPDVVAARRARSKTDDGRRRNREAVQRYRQTPSGRIDHRVRARLRAGLSGDRPGSGWQAALGYTVEDLKRHLERQFLPGMSWENMGDWHIDHILPLKSFTYTSVDDAEFKAAWALTNLRPLWAIDNMKKHARRENLL